MVLFNAKFFEIKHDDVVITSIDFVGPLRLLAAKNRRTNQKWAFTEMALRASTGSDNGGKYLKPPGTVEAINA